MKKISYLEYRRRVFNHAMLECFSRIHSRALQINETAEPYNAQMAKKMSDAFYTDLLNLNDCTISETKAKLKDSVTFIQDCIGICEAVADDQMDVAKKEELEIPEDQKIELGPDDQVLIDKVFEEKSPDLQVEQIRDATVKALMEEDKKAQEIRDSLDIAQSQVQAGSDPKVMEETVNRLNRGPTSLMNAIMNAMAGAAVKNVNESSTGPVAVGKVMAENATQIKERAVMMYTLYEAASVFGLKKFTQADVKRIAQEIYYGR